MAQYIGLDIACQERVLPTLCPCRGTLRKAHRLTQKALVELVDLSLIQIHRYEAGTPSSSSWVHAKLARALRVSADSLVFEQDERGPDEEFRLQFEAFTAFDKDEKKAAKALLTPSSSNTRPADGPLRRRSREKEARPRRPGFVPVGCLRPQVLRFTDLTGAEGNGPYPHQRSEHHPDWPKVLGLWSPSARARSDSVQVLPALERFPIGVLEASRIAVHPTLHTPDRHHPQLRSQVPT
jgi:transcriptional regulator with XRE-family HTH domain